MADSKISELKDEFKKNTAEQKNTSKEIDNLGDRLATEGVKRDEKNRDFFKDRIVPNLKKIGDIPNGFAKSISKLSNKIADKTGIKATADTLGSALKALLAGLGGVIGVKGFLEGWSKVSDYFGDVPGIQQKLAAGLTGIIDKIFNLTPEQEQKVFDTINGFMQGVVDLFTGFVNWWNESGKESALRFLDGLKALFSGDFSTALKKFNAPEWMQNVVDFFKELSFMDFAALAATAVAAWKGFKAVMKVGVATIAGAAGGAAYRATSGRTRGAPARTPMTSSGIKPSANVLPRVVGKTKSGENVVRSSKGNLAIQGADGKATTRKVSADDLMKVGRFAKFLKVLGPLGLGFGAVEMAAILNSNMSMGDKQKAIAKSVAGILGGATGALAGAALGSLVFPGLGTAVGGIGGGIVGMLGAEAAAGYITDWLFGGNTAAELDRLVKSQVAPSSATGSPNVSTTVSSTPPAPLSYNVNGNNPQTGQSNGNVGVAVGGDTYNTGISTNVGVKGVNMDDWGLLVP